MAKTIRVRLKAFEDMADTFKCCEENNAVLRKIAGMVLTVFAVSTCMSGACRVCGKRVEDEPCFEVVDGGGICVPVSDVDIDEGSASAKATT